MRIRGRMVLAVLSPVVLVGSILGGAASARDHGTVKLDARLTGAQEVPPADPDGRGRAKLTVDVDGGEVCFDISTDDTGTPNRGHIHSGASGVNGPIVIPFFELRENPADPRHDALEHGKLSDCVSASSALLADIVANPGNYYVNLHNARFPGGAIRCQLEP